MSRQVVNYQPECVTNHLAQFAGCEPAIVNGVRADVHAEAVRAAALKPKARASACSRRTTRSGVSSRMTQELAWLAKFQIRRIDTGCYERGPFNDACFGVQLQERYSRPADRSNPNNARTIQAKFRFPSLLAWVEEVHKVPRFRIQRRNVACFAQVARCLLYTSPSPRDQRGSRMPSSA